MLTLAQAYTAVAAKLPIEDINVKRRLDRGYDICISAGYVITLADQHNGHSGNLYVVDKASTSLLEDSSARYYVDDVSCTCPDFEKARAGLCKHRLAVMLKREQGAL